MNEKDSDWVRWGIIKMSAISKTKDLNLKAGTYLKSCGHTCNKPGDKCCICKGRGECLSCNERQRMELMR